MSCGCGECRCKGKAIIEQDEYDGLVRLASENVDLRDAAIQVVELSKDHDLKGMLGVYIKRLGEAVNQ